MKNAYLIAKLVWEEWRGGNDKGIRLNGGAKVMNRRLWYLTLLHVDVFVVGLGGDVNIA